jgi:biopolymer transport protein ExbD
MAFSTTASTFRGDGLSSEINVTPLIDVLLVMLILFMVIVPDMPRGLDSALPSPAPAGVAEAADRPVLVQVARARRRWGYAMANSRSLHCAALRSG